MADRDTAMINFRLNLSKREDKEIYDCLQNFDSPDFKAVLKGGRSNFIKMVLLSFIHNEKQEQEAIKALAERKAQNEELVEMIGARLDENQRTLLQALPELVGKVVLEALKGKIVAGVKNGAGDGDLHAARIRNGSCWCCGCRQASWRRRCADASSPWRRRCCRRWRA